ncbi:sensor histidine kinase [Pseudalkalibacillus hwajinpoensis]|uniref:sensor histidine kinase n=1 Tax=Guptibacillus hwajinpoensis TaxID=208199 RepID=UPI001CD7F7B9|nr:sensor histidine kinase [Pseudalkalibacillus hwajinpoensis]MCA0991354.1 sensor histidine kinase [Pseudalkalibacillus hwajinpoensis]
MYMRMSTSSIRMKLIISSFCLMVLAMGVVGGASYYITNKIMIEKTYETNENTLSTMADTFEYTVTQSLNKAQNLSQRISAIYQTLNDTEDPNVVREIITQVNYEKQNFLHLNKEFKSSVVLTEENIYFSGASSDELYFNSSHEDLLTELAKLPDEPLILNSKFKKRAFSNQALEDELMIAMKTVVGKKELYIIWIIDPTILSPRYKQGDYSIIQEENNTLLWSSTGKQPELSVSQFSLTRGSFERERSYLTYYKSKILPWVFLHTISKEELLHEVNGNKMNIWITACVIGVFFFLLSIRFSKRFVNPFVMLKYELDQKDSFDSGEMIKKKNGRKIHLQTKLILFYSVHSILPAMILSVVLYFLALQIIEEKVYNSSEEAVEMAANNISFLVSNIEQTSYSLALYDGVQNMFYHERIGESIESDRRQLSEYITKQMLFEDSISYINLYDPKGALLYSTETLIFDQADSKKEEYLPLPEGRETSWILNKQDMNQSLDYPFIRKVRYLIPSGFSAVLDESIQDNKALFVREAGYIEVGLSEQALKILFQKLKWGDKSGALLINNQGTIISHLDARLIGGSLEEGEVGRLLEGMGSTLKVEDNKNYTIYKTIPSFEELKLVFNLPRDEIEKDTYYILIGNLGMILLVIIVVSFLSFILSRKIIQPIDRLQTVMAEVELGDLEIRYPLKTVTNEVDALINSFNHMMNRINTLVNEVYKAKITQNELEISKQEMERKKKEAELIAFHSQINPHFLYNTFTSINFMIKLNQNERASRMLDSLGRLFRKGVYRGNIIVSVEEEIEHVKAYLEILQMRYQDTLKVELKIDEDLYRYDILKLTLQPLVENAIHHGLEMNDEEGKLLIIGEIIEGHMVFIIKDNGEGMDKQKLEEIQSYLLHGGHARGIGLKNVDNRMKLYFGEDYGLEIESVPNEGTTVTMKIPLLIKRTSKEKEA